MIVSSIRVAAFPTSQTPPRAHPLVQTHFCAAPICGSTIQSQVRPVLVFNKHFRARFGKSRGFTTACEFFPSVRFQSASSRRSEAAQFNSRRTLSPRPERYARVRASRAGRYRACVCVWIAGSVLHRTHRPWPLMPSRCDTRQTCARNCAMVEYIFCFSVLMRLG